MACSQCVKCLCRLSNEGYIIAYYSKNRNIPLTRADHIRKYRKTHSAIQHEYLALATKHSSLDKRMFNFTIKGRGRGVYTKLIIASKIKSYITYLISNSKADIYYFTNIEIGSEFSNPHVHSQIWSDDIEAVEKIYDKVIEEFSLTKKWCRLEEPQRDHKFYTYVIKDYSKDLSDDEVWNLEQTKKRMRNKIVYKNGLKHKLNIRFYSKSKGKYTQKAYRYFYHAFGTLRGLADDFMDWFFSLFFKKRRVFKCSISSFITIKNKGVIVYTCFVNMGRLFDILLVLFYAPSRGPPFS